MNLHQVILIPFSLDGFEILSRISGMSWYMANISWLIYTKYYLPHASTRFSLVGGFSNPVEKIYDHQNGWVKFIFTNFRGENMKGLKIHHLGVSENGGFSPQIIHFNRDFHYESSILGETPLFLETPT